MIVFLSLLGELCVQSWKSLFGYDQRFVVLLQWNLKPDNILDIVCLSLMSFDDTTLQRFGLSVLPADFLTDNEEHGIVRKTANIQHCMGFVKTCVHYYNFKMQFYGNRRVFLNQQKGVWKIMSILALVDSHEVFVCPVCNNR